MRKIVLYTLIVIVFNIFLWLPEPRCTDSQTSIENNEVSDKIMFDVERAFLYAIAKDMTFLEETKLNSIEELVEDLSLKKEIKYRPKLFEKRPGISLPSFYKKGGNCLDFTAYTVARLIQLKKPVGIIVLKANNNKKYKSHIAALTILHGNDPTVVIDGTFNSKNEYIVVMNEYIKLAKLSGNFISCKTMWFIPRLSSTTSILLK